MRTDNTKDQRQRLDLPGCDKQVIKYRDESEATSMRCDPSGPCEGGHRRVRQNGRKDVAAVCKHSTCKVKMNMLDIQMNYSVASSALFLCILTPLCTTLIMRQKLHSDASGTLYPELLQVTCHFAHFTPSWLISISLHRCTVCVCVYDK